MTVTYPDQDTILSDYYKKADFTFVEDEKFQSTYVPKIKAYVTELELSQPAELKLPERLLPDSLDSQIDAIKLLYDSGALTERELEITDTPAADIVSKIASSEWTSVEVFKAFAHRAIIGNQLANFAFQFFLDEGLQKAEYLDEYLAKNGKTVGPLHGLPMSLKEHLEYAGKVTHAGFVSKIEEVFDKSGPTIEIFDKLGCVFYVRTSQPQTIMHLDTNNNIIGRTRNPNNLSLSPGGSSGGEGAIIAIGGSPIGIGSDIGGSIRCPAAFCGTFGFKPTSRRMSLGHPNNGLAAPESVVPTLGPLSRNVGDLEMFMRSYVNDGEPWLTDPWALRIPWKDVKVPEPHNLKIGILWDDGIVKPFPPIERGLKYVAEKLAKAGVTIVDFKPHRTQEAYDAVHLMYTIDGNKGKKIVLGESGEPLLPLTKWYLTYGEGDKEMSVSENHDLNSLRNVLRADYLNLMNEAGLDFIISPTSYNVAAIPDKVHYWGYTSLWNILDLPTLVFPTGLKQDPSIDTAIKDYKPRNVLELLELPNYDDPTRFENAPIGLQLSARRYFDEEVLAAGKLISKILEI